MKNIRQEIKAQMTSQWVMFWRKNKEIFSKNQKDDLFRLFEFAYISGAVEGQSRILTKLELSKDLRSP